MSLICSKPTRTSHLILAKVPTVALVGPTTSAGHPHPPPISELNTYFLPATMTWMLFLEHTTIPDILLPHGLCICCFFHQIFTQHLPSSTSGLCSGVTFSVNPFLTLLYKTASPHLQSLSPSLFYFSPLRISPFNILYYIILLYYIIVCLSHWKVLKEQRI